jgi:DNA-binding NtrC family response regulator
MAKIARRPKNDGCGHFRQPEIELHSRIWEMCDNDTAWGGTQMTARILVVDDDDACCRAIAHVLAAAGFEIVQAHDYRDALPVLEDGLPLAMLVTDLVMPGVNGFALARMGRMRHRDLKAIFVTGFDNVPLKEASGPVLRKPIKADLLLATVQETLKAPNPTAC